jgi:hypothetical protein
LKQIFKKGNLLNKLLKKATVAKNNGVSDEIPKIHVKPKLSTKKFNILKIYNILHKA